MITNRDIEVIKFINVFGKSYDIVLSKTFFKSEAMARKRIAKINKMELVSFWKTNLMSPRRAIVLTNEAKEYLKNELEIKPKNPKLNITTLQHNIIEQLAYYHLLKIGKVIRTTVYEHGNKLHHIPDFILETGGKRINIEVELTKKSVKRYTSLLMATKKDNIDAILYIVKNKSDIERLKNHLPKDNRLLFIDIDSMIDNINHHNKINPISP